MGNLNIKTGIIISMVWVLGHSGFSPIENDLRPDYTIVNLRPNGFEPLVSDLAWLSNGQLVVVQWANHKEVHNRQFEGEIYLLDGVKQATSPSGVTVNTFKTGIEDPTGVWVINDTIYTAGGYYIIGHIDANKDGTPEAADTIFNFDYAEKCRHEFFHGLVYKDGDFFATASRCKDGRPLPPGAYSNTWQLHTGRGAHYKINRATGTATLIAGGFRSPYGMSLGPLGDIFVSDNQGSWLPSSKIINPKPGRFYGFYADNYTPEEEYGAAYANVEESPPVLWLIHNQISNSPSHPLYVDHGIYEGQILFGDVAYGGIQRGFLEMVNGDWQGAAFNWTGGLEAGAGTIIWGDNGTMYVGGLGIGDQNNWGYRGTRTGLQKLVPVPNAPILFEMLEVRTRATGMEIVFTKTVNTTQASNISNYTIRHTEEAPIRNYGGGSRQNAADVSITSATVSPDKKRVFLAVNMNQLRGGGTLQPNTVLEITLNNNIKSEDGNDLWIGKAWYTLNNISTSTAFDINGCTDSRYQEYNAQATFDDGTCRNVNASIRVENSPSISNININGNYLSIDLKKDKIYQAEIWNVKGELVVNRLLSGMGNYQLNVEELRGVHFLKLKNKGEQTIQKFTLF